MRRNKAKETKEIEEREMGEKRQKEVKGEVDDIEQGEGAPRHLYGARTGVLLGPGIASRRAEGDLEGGSPEIRI